MIYIWQGTDIAKTLKLALVQEGLLLTGFDR